MNFSRKCAVCMLLVIMCCTSCVRSGSSKGSDSSGKDGILLVTFGSTFEAPQATFKKIDEVASAKFPNTEIRWAYTSEFILKRLRQGLGKGALKGQVIEKDTPEAAIEKMVKAGYSKITVQSLHIIPGEEFDELVSITKHLTKKHEGLQIAIGRPLLDTEKDLQDVAKILADKYTDEVAVGTPVLFMGHGSAHHVNHQKYADLEVEMQKIAPHFFIGTVEKYPMINDVLTLLDGLELDSKDVLITPLMSIVGDHANNDMVGSTESAAIEDQSWKERLVGAGYTGQIDMMGLGDNDEIIAIWMSHLEDVQLK